MDKVTDSDGWQDRFRSNVTRVRFVINLTRPMMEMLCACSDDVSWDRRRFGGITFPDNWISTEHALTTRGLLERKPPRPVTDSSPPFKLTPAGEALVELMKVGGIFIPAREAVERASARKGRH
jgi:hypothetical protein